MTQNRLYRVTFVNQGQVYEVYARSISHGGLLGFLEIEELVFGEKSAIVVDPSEEKLQQEFAGVERTYVPLHAVLRVDQVTKQGPARIQPVVGESAKIMPFPLYTTGGGDHKK
jgi:hypothetical protein